MQLKPFYPLFTLGIANEKIPGSPHLHNFNVYIVEWRKNTARSIPENFICCLIDSMLFDGSRGVGSFVEFVVSCIVNSISIHLFDLQLFKVGLL